MEIKKELKTVKSETHPMSVLFDTSYTVDFYQREYVWQKKQIEDLINDLSAEFMKNWKSGHDPEITEQYDPYFMGEVVLSETPGANSVIDGQQRITTFTLLLIFIINRFKGTPDFPQSSLDRLIYKDKRSKWKFTLDIEERNECMMSLYKNGCYTPSETKNVSVYKELN